MKHYYLRGKMAKEDEAKLDKFYGTCASSNAIVKRWMREFKFSRTSTNDDSRSVRPSDAITSEMIKKILRSVINDRKLKVREISNMVSIPTEHVHNILHNHLKRWLAGKKFYSNEKVIAERNAYFRNSLE